MAKFTEGSIVDGLYKDRGQNHCSECTNYLGICVCRKDGHVAGKTKMIEYLMFRPHFSKEYLG